MAIDYDNGVINGGYVEEISSKPSRNGQFHSIKVDGDWFGYGSYPPKFGQGAVIDAEITWNGDYANINTKSINVIEWGNTQRGGGNGGGQRRPQGQGGGGGQRGGYGQQQRSQGQGQRPQGNGQGGGHGGGQRPPAQRGGGNDPKDKYWEDKAARDVQVQASIQWQASRNSAIALVDMLLKNGLVGGLPKEKAKQADAIVALVDEYTTILNAQTYDVMNNGAPSCSQAPGQQDDGGGEPPFEDDMPNYQE